MAHEEYIRMVPGGRTAVLMIHGILGSPDHFREFIPLIPKDWSVHSILLDGHGGKMEAFAASSMEKWKAQVSARVEELLAIHERVYIIAHSMGTLFAIQQSLRHPDRIPQLFLLGSPMRVHVTPGTVVNSILLPFGYVNRKNRSAVDMQEKLSVTPSPCLPKYILWIPRFLELFREIYRTKKLLPQVTVPTQVFQSKHDELVRFSSCKDFAGFPAITCTPLYDSGHFGYGDGDMALLKERFAEMIRTVA